MHFSLAKKCAATIACLIFGLAWFLVTGSPSEAAPPADPDATTTYLRVTKLTPGQVLWVRSGPSILSQRIGFFRYNDRNIRGYGCKTVRVAWCEVQYRGARGWALKLYLTEDEARSVQSHEFDRRVALGH